VNIFLNVFTAVFLLGILSITLMVNYFFLTEIILGRRKLDAEIKYTFVPNPNKIVGCEKRGEEMLLLQKLHDLRVLRSSCSDSNEGDFRVHLHEEEFNEIQKLVKEMREGR